MNRTKDKLLLECIKQFEHIENVLGYNRLSTTRSLINEINQALTIPAFVGQSEQFSLSDIYKIAQNYTEEQFIEMVKHVQG